VGRKGIYELRAAIHGLEIKLMTRGPLLEGKDFWDGLQVDQGGDDDDWLAGATAVVLPSFAENRPRKLLEAVARGVPVIASTACGLENISGVMNVPAGDVRSLRAEIEKVLDNSNINRQYTESGRDLRRKVQAA
jgi:glycosyltransferase involved in cell wall biosynthesis